MTFMKEAYAASQHTSSGRPWSVLVVDDDAFMLEIVRDLFEALGVSRVTTAQDGDEALRQLSAAGAPPDMVVCDINMPGKDGFLVMAALAASHYRGRVLVISGMDARTRKSASLMGRFHRLNVVGTLAKPVQRAELEAALEIGRA